VRILLVEDDVMIGEGLTAALGAEGMSVDWVRNGAAAEAALCDEGFAIVLLDLGLPDADGQIFSSRPESRASTPRFSSSLLVERSMTVCRASTSAPMITCSSHSSCASSRPA
jgi:CheY-like chemotaxis protein